MGKNLSLLSLLSSETTIYIFGFLKFQLCGALAGHCGIKYIQVGFSRGAALPDPVRSRLAVRRHLDSVFSIAAAERTLIVLWSHCWRGTKLERAYRERWASRAACWLKEVTGSLRSFRDNGKAWDDFLQIGLRAGSWKLSCPSRRA